MSSKIVIILPCYNEEKRLPVDEFKHYIQNQPDIHFIFVNDGSKDQTQDILSKLQKFNRKQIQVLTLNKNHGKAEAVRQGVLHALTNGQYSYIGYLDSDLATPLSEIDYLSQFLKENSKLFVFGSRVKRIGVRINRKWYRHYLGRIFATFAALILDIPIYDTQCGAKLKI